MADTVGGRGVGTNSDTDECDQDSEAVGENEIDIVAVVYVTCWEVCYGDGLFCSSIARARVLFRHIQGVPVKTEETSLVE